MSTSQKLESDNSCPPHEFSYTTRLSAAKRRKNYFLTIFVNLFRNDKSRETATSAVTRRLPSSPVADLMDWQKHEMNEPFETNF